MVNFNSLAESPALVPVFAGTINSQSVQLCDARTLHTFMGVLRDFSNWIKGRIRKFEFVNGVDFLAISRSPELASGNRGAAINYHLTLDMAKELAMVENNPKGREARRYFIDCEKRALATLTAPTRARITTAQAQHLKELVHLVAESGRQTYGETWERLHRKMKVNSYLELAASQFDEACNYLRGKMDDTSMAALIQKHFPRALGANPPQAMTTYIPPDAQTSALPAPDHIASAFMAAQGIGAQVQKAMFNAVLLGNDDWKFQQWNVSFITDSKMAVPALVQKMDADEFVTSVSRLASTIHAGRMPAQDVEVLFEACARSKFKTACANTNRGYGQEVAATIKSDMSWADLHAINQAAAMEVWMRSNLPQPAAIAA